VIHRVHHTTPNFWTPTLPAFATCLAEAGIANIRIANLTDRGIALSAYHPNFPRRELEGNKVSFLSGHLSTSSGCPYQLPPPSRNQFHIVNYCTQGNIAKRQSITDLNRSVWPRANYGSYCQTSRMKNVSLFPVLIVEQRNTGVAVGIIFNRRNLSWNCVLITVEINNAVKPLMATTTMPTGNNSTIIAALWTVTGNR
jgi:hypothetical protein